MSILTIPQALFKKLGKKESDALLQVIGKAVNGSESKTIERVGDKFEKRLVEETSKLREEMSKLKNDLMKWQFAQTILIILTILGAKFFA